LYRTFNVSYGHITTSRHQAGQETDQALTITHCPPCSTHQTEDVFGPGSALGQLEFLFG
jgi:hypothetical protein